MEVQISGRMVPWSVIVGIRTLRTGIIGDSGAEIVVHSFINRQMTAEIGFSEAASRAAYRQDRSGVVT